MHPMLNIGIRAARAAGKILLRYVDRVDELDITAKGFNEFVSEVDRIAEQAIIDTLRKAYPHHAVLAEESGLQGEAEYQWIVDPLDGTTNFLHGFPQFSVSIALQHKGRLEQSVVYDPLREELFTATRGEGAQLNSRRIRVSKCSALRNALLGTGYPYRDLSRIDTYLSVFRTLMAETAGIRRPGSAALDLAYVAAGRLDGFWEFGLKPWDMAAGALLIQEAGGIVGDIEGGDTYLVSGDVVAANPRIYQLLLDTLRTNEIPRRSRR